MWISWLSKANYHEAFGQYELTSNLDTFKLLQGQSFRCKVLPNPLTFFSQGVIRVRKHSLYLKCKIMVSIDRSRVPPYDMNRSVCIQVWPTCDNIISKICHTSLTKNPSQPIYFFVALWPSFPNCQSASPSFSTWKVKTTHPS